jgi:hypothetical protein
LWLSPPSRPALSINLRHSLAIQSALTFFALARPLLDLTFFSGATFLPAYVFFGDASVFFVVDGLAAGFAVLVAAVGFLTVLAEDALVAGAFDDGALRVDDLVAVVDLPVEVFDFDTGFVAGFEAVLVVGGFDFDVGLF